MPTQAVSTEGEQTERRHPVSTQIRRATLLAVIGWMVFSFSHASYVYSTGTVHTILLLVALGSLGTTLFLVWRIFSVSSVVHYNSGFVVKSAALYWIAVIAYMAWRIFQYSAGDTSGETSTYTPIISELFIDPFVTIAVSAVPFGLFLGAVVWYNKRRTRSKIQ